MTNPRLLMDIPKRFEPTPVQHCIACSAPVRRARILTEITVILDASPTRRGSYFFSADHGLVTEDRTLYTGDRTYRRHRCAKPVMDGWNGDERSA